jgi:hypothetical protein
MIDYQNICTLKTIFLFEGTRVVRRTRGRNANIFRKQLIFVGLAFYRKSNIFSDY